MFFYIVVTQLSFLATTIVSNAAGARVCQSSSCAGAGFAAFSNAWQLFQLPFAIVGVSVITAMLPRMSGHAAAGNNELLTRDFSAATRLSSVIVVPSALILAVLGPPLAEGIFGHGSTSPGLGPVPGRHLRRVLPGPAPVHAVQPVAAGVLRDA